MRRCRCIFAVNIYSRNSSCMAYVYLDLVAQAGHTKKYVSICKSHLRKLLNNQTAISQLHILLGNPFGATMLSQYQGDLVNKQRCSYYNTVQHSLEVLKTSCVVSAIISITSCSETFAIRKLSSQGESRYNQPCDNYRLPFLVIFEANVHPDVFMVNSSKRIHTHEHNLTP